MRRPGIGTLLLVALLGRAGTASSAALEPSADPVAAFIAVADSLHRTDGGAGFPGFVNDNAILVGAVVAKLLDDAFLAAAENPGGEKENVDLAGRIAVAHEAAGGSDVARTLIDTYLRWGKSRRAQRAKAIELEKQSVEVRKTGDVAQAADLLTQARAIYEKIGDRHSVAVNWGTMGVTHWSAGDYDVVIADYEQALAARRAVEDRILEGRTLNGLGSAYQQKSEWDRAADYYRQAIELREKTGDLGGLGTSITFLGHLYNNTGRYVDARNQYEKALPILEATGNAKQMIELLTGIAAVNSSMGRIPDANAAYEKGIALSSQNGLGGYEMLCRRNLADNYRLQGRWSEALDELNASLELLKTSPDANEEALIYQTRGITYLNMGELDSARDDLVRCAELSAALDNPERAILAQNNLGFLYRELGALDRALKASDEARRLSEAAANGRGYREALALRASIERVQGRYAEALATWQEVLAQDQSDGATTLALVDEVAIAAMHGSMGRGNEARVQLHALAPRVRETSLPDLELMLRFALGDSFEKENPDSAAHYYESALSFSEAEGARIGGAEINTGYLSAQWRYNYEEVARFYAGVHASTGEDRWSDLAFRAMERAKARGLLELVTRRATTQPSDEENAVLDALYSLDPATPDHADRRASLEAQYVKLRKARIDQSIPAASRSGNIAGIDEVAASLSGKDVLLEYALGDSASFLWIVDRNGHELVELPPRREIEAEVRALRDALARRGAADRAMLASARSLYTMLVAPGGKRVEKAKSLVIVPDGILFELPFDALLSADPDGEDMRAQPFLARRAATTYSPSATIYASLKSVAREGDYTRDLLAVGNPDFSALAGNGGPPLAPLPFAEAEVQAIGARMKDSRKMVLTGSGASETRVRQELRTEAPRVVHLATHGLVDGAEPERSSVVLAPDAQEDGYFHTLEILATPVHSRLVVISACETARGRVSRGEGVVGLSRAFLGAGAQSVVASLWAVSDESTAELMRVFYDRMFGKKRAASRSLHEARLALIDSGEFSHPFYWSPFVVTGTERSPW